jgi:hypothetical protein
MVLISWLRFLSFFLVISAISRLIMTLIKMLVSCFTFLFIVVCYLLLMTPIFFILFQETTTACIDPLRTLIFLYDSYLGVFSYTQVLAPEYTFRWSIFITVHVFLANTFVLNYLVAILTTVYEEMLEKGDFAYKSNKYMYIERYQIALQD